jgi:hypothetical protein
MVRSHDKRSIIRARGIVNTLIETGVANAKKAAYINSESLCSDARGALRVTEDTMATNVNHMITPIIEPILAVRDRWHTKRHPFFQVFSEGKLPLKALGRYQALHYHFVAYALQSFGLFYSRFYHLEDVRKMMAENLAEEEGF